MDLLTLRFIEKAENIIFCGPGVGKTNLAVSIGIEAAKTQILRILYNISGFNITAKKAASEKQT